MMSIILYQSPHMGLTITYRPHTDLLALILDAIIGSDDAASVRPAQVPVSYFHLKATDEWLAPLQLAYREETERMWVHGVGLHTLNLSALRDHLKQRGGELSQALLHAIDLEVSACEAVAKAEAPLSFEEAWSTLYGTELITRWDSDPNSSKRHIALRDLQRCRRALYADRPPHLTLLHTPSLGSSGRGSTTSDGERIVALSLCEPPEWFFCQALHEEVHALTDLERVVHREHVDTQLRSEGYHAHHARERRAIQRASELIKQTCPQRVEDDQAWRRAYGQEGVTASSSSAETYTPQAFSGFGSHESTLTPTRKRLLITYLMLTSLLWMSILLHIWLGIVCSLLSACLSILLNQAPVSTLVKMGRWATRLRVKLGLYELSSMQKRAIPVSFVCHAVAMFSLM